MAVSVEYSAQDFEGRGLTPYPITFPVDSPADIWVAVKLDGETEFVTLSRADFEVMDLGEEHYQVTTPHTEYTPADIVKVFRLLDVTQPFVFPEGGAFPSRDVERALDRLLMLIQQLRLESGLTGASITLPGEAVTVKGVMVVDDAAERGGTAPEYPGQLLIQLSPQPPTLWIGNGDGSGWSEFQPSHAEMASRLVIAATADAGTPGAAQSKVVERAADWSANYVICAGDNHYEPATFSDSWAAFNSLIAEEKVLPALGNHDKDDWAAHAAKFSYLPSSPANRRYYKKTLGNGLLDVFVLHSGRDSSWEAIEPDGNYPGSMQAQWFAAQLQASTARWKIAVMHHPPVTVSSQADRADTNLDWPEFAQLDGILCGHVHLSEWLTCRGTPVVNVSGGVHADGDVNDVLNLTGVDAIGSNLLWHDDRRQLMVKLTVTPQRFLVGWHEILTGALVYQRDLGDKTAHRHEWGQELVGPSDVVALGQIHVGICPAQLARGVWVLTVAGSGSAPLSGTVLVDGAVAGEWTIPADSYWTEVPSLRNVRRGALVKVNVLANAPYGPWHGLGCYYRGQIVG